MTGAGFKQGSSRGAGFRAGFKQGGRVWARRGRRRRERMRVHVIEACDPLPFSPFLPPSHLPPQARMAEARDLFRNSETTEFVIVTIPTVMRDARGREVVIGG